MEGKIKKGERPEKTLNPTDITKPWKTRLSPCKDLGTGHVEPGTPWDKPDFERMQSPLEEK